MKRKRTILYDIVMIVAMLIMFVTCLADNKISYVIVTGLFSIIWIYQLSRDLKPPVKEESLRYNGLTMQQCNPNIDLKTFQKLVHYNAKMHGWWDEERQFGELIALCRSELSEALEEYRKGKKHTETYYRKEDGKMEGIPSELADVVIRILDMCEYYGIDIESAILEKHKFNISRPYKHGGKVI